MRESAKRNQPDTRRQLTRPLGVNLDDLTPGVRYVLKLHEAPHAIAGVLAGVHWRRGQTPDIVLEMLGKRPKIVSLGDVAAIELAPNPANDEPIPPDAGAEFIDS
jgi:hypothetical protein